jgi:oxaloacetate decarboxylase gamma subunit
MADLDSSSQLFSQAAVLLMVGMAFVFAFLSLLIVVIKLLITPLGLRYPDSAPKQAKTKANNQLNNESSAVVAAISVAVKKYRERQQK